MKFLCLILMCYVFLLSVQPCCIDRDCTSASEVKQASSHSHSKDCCRECSPFYSCGSCTGFPVAVHHSYHFQIIPIHQPVVYPNDIAPHTDEVALSIWLPPQLV